MKKNLLFLTLLLFVSFGIKATDRVKPTIQSKTTFAIVIDKASYENVKAEVLAYRDVVEKDGLGTYILVDDWESPADIREELIKLHKDKKAPLEGAVFVGNIPIPMIRDAQHLSSAFKMDQKNKWQRSSIPSDRYYDDFGLEFDFLKQDTARTDYFYYSLRPDSKQYIASDIYSARIRPLKNKDVDEYTQLRNYFRKVVDERTNNKDNVIDNLSVARGHGYNSESKIAWAGEHLALKEQFPKAFMANNRVKLMDFDSYWPMKPYWLNEVQKDELDIMLFHHHGGIGAQYVSGYKSGSDVNTSKENIKLYMRSKIKSGVEKGRDKEEVIQQYVDYLDVPRHWAEETFDPAIQEKDSLLYLDMDIIVDDILKIKPKARFIMFDACYNGSFYADENVAGAYIFNEGKTIVVQGNTVNTIQDKWPDEFVGLLGAGLRVGQWHKQIQFLEGHLIGDPTFRFANNTDVNFDINEALTIRHGDVKFWEKQLHSPNVDVQAMALRVLFDNKYGGISSLLKKSYFESSSMIVRLEAMRLLSLLDNDDFEDVLASAMLDSYELIRRFAVEYGGKNGSDKLIGELAKTIIDDNISRRIVFKMSSAMKMVDQDKLLAELKRQASQTSFYDDSKIKDAIKSIEGNKKSIEATIAAINSDSTSRKDLITEIKLHRNHPAIKSVDTLLKFVKDSSKEADLRVIAIETLGWFNYSHRKSDIINGLEEVRKEAKDKAVIDEATKSINRLKRI